jgi:dihydrodipicolinate synthase/N-acetylneuraminate lyase
VTDEGGDFKEVLKEAQKKVELLIESQDKLEFKELEAESEEAEEEKGAELVARVRETLLAKGTLTVAQARDLFGTSRKYVLALRGVPVGGVRAPLSDPSPAEQEAIRKGLRELKLL